jgi:hypothetical protein
MAHHFIMLCSSLRDPTIYSYPFIHACRTLLSSPSLPRHCCLRCHYRCHHISCCHCSHCPWHHPCHRRPFVDCSRSHHRLVVVSLVRSIRLFTMSQSRFLQEEYSKKYRKAANNAAINSAITDLVAARGITWDGCHRRDLSRHVGEEWSQRGC